MKRTVLVVTNNLLTYETLRHPLQTADCEVVLAMNDHASREHCVGTHPDLLLVDLDWPSGGGDGCDVVKQVTDICPCVPLIVISARADVREAVESLGVAAVAEKPIDVPMLLRIAEEAMHARPDGNGNHDVDFHRLPPNPEAFREALLRRANAPFEAARQPRGWGLNE